MTDELIWGGLGNLRFLQVNSFLSQRPFFGTIWGSRLKIVPKILVTERALIVSTGFPNLTLFLQPSSPRASTSIWSMVEWRMNAVPSPPPPSNHIIDKNNDKDDVDHRRYAQGSSHALNRLVLLLRPHRADERGGQAEGQGGQVFLKEIDWAGGQCAKEFTITPIKS